MIKENNQPFKKFKYDIIVVDEAQDMSSLYYKLVVKIISNNLCDPRICVIGDKYQCIYQFKEADDRFITLADRIFTMNNLEWKELKLSTSYRITNQMANFINHCVMGFNYINACKEGNKVRYIMTETFNCDRPLEEVLYYLDDCHFDDIFIIAPSIKNPNCPVRKLENRIKTLLLNVKLQRPEWLNNHQFTTIHFDYIILTILDHYNWLDFKKIIGYP